MQIEGVKLDFQSEALDLVVERALERKTGARALRAIMEDVMLEIMYKVPSMKDIEKVSVSEKVVKEKEKPLYIFKSSKKTA